MKPDIILIGPIGSGKSTLARLLAAALQVPNYSADELCWDYYAEIGFVRGDPDSLGPDGMIASRFTSHAVERLLSTHSSCVIDLGAGHSVYQDEPSLARVETALNDYPNVILVLPSPDLDESSAILAERNAGNNWLHTFISEHGYDPNEQFLRHPSNFRLANSIIYTYGRSPEDSREEILGLLKQKPIRNPGEPTSVDQEKMIGVLAEALDKAKAGEIRSLVMLSMNVDGTSGCFASIRSESDSATALSYLDDLKGDLRG